MKTSELNVEMGGLSFLVSSITELKPSIVNGKNTGLLKQMEGSQIVWLKAVSGEGSLHAAAHYFILMMLKFCRVIIVSETAFQSWPEQVQADFDRLLIHKESFVHHDENYCAFYDAEDMGGG
ncbi:hypothetical protein [Paenibacillus beijingensis]|uniref:hypothetical protein n=1 Tax=Paenibacillus beijingensis TaxID=1126833 RepID=UPI000A821DD8|nr:hypothetical protein [Paenibacillus beijingensis]